MLASPGQPPPFAQEPQGQAQSDPGRGLPGAIFLFDHRRAQGVTGANL